MKIVRKSLAGLGLGVALSAAYLVGGSLVKDVQFAHAQAQVEATRQQIANIQDMAAVYKAVGKAVEPSVVSIDVRKTMAQTDNPMFRRFFPDRNGDGLISRDEAERGPVPFIRAHFDRIDRQHRGAVSVDDVKAYIASLQRRPPAGAASSGGK